MQWHLVGKSKDLSKAMRSDTLTPRLTDRLLEFLAWLSLQHQVCSIGVSLPCYQSVPTVVGLKFGNHSKT